MNSSGDAWTAGIERVRAESGGALRIYILPPKKMLNWLEMANAGNEEAIAIVLALNDLISKIRAWQEHAPAPCGCCQRPLRRRFTVALAMPVRSDPRHCIGMGLCDRCSADKAGIKQRVNAAFRDVWPDAVLVDLIHQDGGRA